MSAWVNLQQTTTTNEPAGGWQWIEIDGSASNPITPIPWIPGQPDNSGGAQNQGVYIGASSGISDEKQSSFTPTGTFCQCCKKFMYNLSETLAEFSYVNKFCHYHLQLVAF